jgi:hypothetical protein
MPRASSVSLTPPAMLPEQHTIAEPSGSNAVSSALSVAHGRHGTSDNPTTAIPIAFARPHPSVPAGTRVPTSYCMPGTQIVQTGMTSSHHMAPNTDLAETRKRKNEDAIQMDSCKRQAAHNFEGNNQVSLVALLLPYCTLCLSGWSILTEMFTTYNYNSSWCNLTCGAWSMHP